MNPFFYAYFWPSVIIVMSPLFLAIYFYLARKDLFEDINEKKD